MSQTHEDTTRKNGEGLVVTEGGVRVSGAVHRDEASAADEISRRKKQITEKTGSPAPVVRQQLFG